MDSVSLVEVVYGPAAEGGVTGVADVAGGMSGNVDTDGWHRNCRRSSSPGDVGCMSVGVEQASVWEEVEQYVLSWSIL